MKVTHLPLWIGFVIVLGYAIVLSYSFYTQRNRLKQLEVLGVELDKRFQHNIDSAREHFRELIQEDSLTIREYSLAVQRYQKAENDAILWRSRYEKEKNKPIVRRDGAAVDSVLAALYPN